MRKTTIKNKKVTTIDGLAVLMNKGFERVDKMIADGRKETNKLAVLIADVSEETNKLARMIADGRKETNKLAVLIADVSEETNKLARMIAKGFENVDKEMNERFGKVEKDIAEVNDNLVSTRGDILAMGDRFTLKYEFYDLSTRVGVLEQKQKVKMKK